MQILIPCKPLDRGKSRLSPHLDPAARRALCESFLAQTLSLASVIVPASAVYLVTGDPAAARIAAGHGVSTLVDNAFDLNTALLQARARLLSDSVGVSDVLILPIDLPDATPDAFSELLGHSAQIGIVPDRTRQGTNVLFLRAAAFEEFPFGFGAGSFMRHCAVAVAMSRTLQVTTDHRLARDIDEFADYEDWVRRTPRGSSWQARNPG